MKTHSEIHPALAVLCCLLAVVLLLAMVTIGDSDPGAVSVAVPAGDIFAQNVTNRVSQALDGIVPIRRIYRLSDSDPVAPKPNPDCYGQTEDPSAIQGVLDQAEVLLDGQKTFFTTQTPVRPGSTIRYYLDETLFSVTWKQPVDECLYTFAEVKIAHPSQFRRFLAGNKYNFYIIHKPTELARSVNAVLASAGDYYSYREIGIVVNNGQVYREKGHFLDTCYIDENGDLLFTMAGEYTDKEAIQKFVDDNHIRFSLSFGPLIIRDGECCVPEKYNSGEIHQNYVRSALCQLGPLHYLVVTANTEDPYYILPTVDEFASRLQEMGIQTAYCLDGGQTAAIVMNNRMVNPVSYGAEREISDIIYFATALPEEQKKEAVG